LAVPPALRGQEPLAEVLLVSCRSAGLAVELAPLCGDVATAVQIAQPELGLLLAGGNPVLGTASPIGTKFRFIPRVHISGRINFVSGGLPDVIDYPDPLTTGSSVGQRSFSATMPQFDISVGVFDGLQLAPTLDGFASVELMGSLGSMILPSGAGFRNDVAGFGLGARLGLLRESFTAPGISISGEYRWTGRIRYGDVSRGTDAGEFGLDLGVTSFRAGLSKSFVAFGLALTLAWDRYESDVDFGVADASGNLLPVVGEQAPIELTAERWSGFVDVSYIVLFLNFVAELGWQETQRLLTSTGTEVESGKVFGAIGIRLSL
jgi:hypothetical protein